MERRNLDAKFELRAADGQKPGRVSGYAAVFDKLSEDMGGYRERMAPYAFDGITNGADIRVFWDHDTSQPLGRTRAGTARIAPDTQGLHFEVDFPDTVYARDLWTSIERGDVSGASIGFFIGDEAWSNDEAGNPVRTITRVSQLVEASIVSIPAYPDTGIATDVRTWSPEAVKRVGEAMLGLAHTAKRNRMMHLMKIGAWK